MERVETVRNEMDGRNGTEGWNGTTGRNGTEGLDETERAGTLQREVEQDREGRNRTEYSTGLNGTGRNWTEGRNGGL